MYTVHIESTDNSWFGTGFMGIGIESMNDLKEASAVKTGTIN